MNWQSFISGCSLAMDAFAVSAGVGAAYPSQRRSAGIRLGAACGLFQFIMPLLGGFLGGISAQLFAMLGPFLASFLLMTIGLDMILDALKDRPVPPISSGKRLLFLALATSIDAFAVGAGFALVGFSVMELAVIAGIVTALGCVLGAALGAVFGARLGSKAAITGGGVLMLLGAYILIVQCIGMRR